MKTHVGQHCLLMVGAHVAHDCIVGNHVIMANHATLGGHVVLEDHVILGGLSAVHQFVRIGQYAMVGGMSGVEKDVLPYATVMGERAHLSGLNLVGLRRHEFPNEVVHRLQEVYDTIFQDQGTFAQRVDRVESMLRHQPNDACEDVLRFIHLSKKSLCAPKIKG